MEQQLQPLVERAVELAAKEGVTLKGAKLARFLICLAKELLDDKPLSEAVIICIRRMREEPGV